MMHNESKYYKTYFSKKKLISLRKHSVNNTLPLQKGNEDTTILLQQCCELSSPLSSAPSIRYRKNWNHHVTRLEYLEGALIFEVPKVRQVYSDMSVCMCFINISRTACLGKNKFYAII